MNELWMFATRFIFGMATIMILQLIYGPTGWNVLIAGTIYAAYLVGQLRTAYFVRRLHTYRKETEV